MRHTRSHTRNRRSHHALKRNAIVVDETSRVPHLRHRASLDTGRYKDRQVIDKVANVTKKQTQAK